jgi:PAS domain-containing protein
MDDLPVIMHQQFDTLVDKFERHLLSLPDYARLAQAGSATQDIHLIAQRDLEALLRALETGNDKPFITMMEDIVPMRIRQGFQIDTLLSALDGLEATVQPLANDLASTRYLWRLFGRVRSAIAIVADRSQSESATQMQTVLDASPMPILISQFPDGKPLVVNRQLSAMFGLPPEEVMSRRTEEFYADPSDRQRVVNILQQDGRLKITSCCCAMRAAHQFG